MVVDTSFFGLIIQRSHLVTLIKVKRKVSNLKIWTGRADNNIRGINCHLADK